VKAAGERSLALHYQPRKTLSLAVDRCSDLFVIGYNYWPTVWYYKVLLSNEMFLSSEIMHLTPPCEKM